MNFKTGDWVKWRQIQKDGTEIWHYRKITKVANHLGFLFFTDGTNRLAAWCTKETDEQKIMIEILKGNV